MDKEMNENELNTSKIMEEISIDPDNLVNNSTSHCKPSSIPKDESLESEQDSKCLGISETIPVSSRRSSVCKLFDPLHMKNISELKEKMLLENNDLVEIVKNMTNDDSVGFDKSEVKGAPPENLHFEKDIPNKNVPNTHNAGSLISFESPKKLPNPLIPKISFLSKFSKKYTEEEFRQKLDNQKCQLMKECSQKYAECEMRYNEKELRVRREITETVNKNKLFNTIISELLETAERKAENSENIKEKLKDLYFENETLKMDITASKNDLSNRETAFSDLSKNYEKCKSIIKALKENEEQYENKIDSLKIALEEQTSKNYLMESRKQDQIDKAMMEVDAAKKASANEKAVLEAELKKAEIKLDSLKKDLEQGKLEKEKHSSIYDGLLSKFKV